MALPCHLLLGSPIFLTPYVFATAASPSKVYISILYLFSICILATFVFLAGQSRQQGLYLCLPWELVAFSILKRQQRCRWTHSHSQRTTFVSPNNRKFTLNKKYKYSNVKIYNHKNIQIHTFLVDIFSLSEDSICFAKQPQIH